MQRVDHVLPIYYKLHNFRALLHLPTLSLSEHNHEYPTYIPEPGATVSDLAFPAGDQMK